MRSTGVELEVRLCWNMILKLECSWRDGKHLKTLSNHVDALQMQTTESKTDLDFIDIEAYNRTFELKLPMGSDPYLGIIQMF